MKTATLSNEARYKAGAAFHEAGHAVAALSFYGTSVRAYIKPAKIPHWNGRCCFAVEDYIKSTVNPCIGAAGEIAEHIRHGLDASDFDYFCVEDFNESDRRYLTAGNVKMAIADAHEILSHKWSLVESIAAALLKHENLTEEMILAIVATDYATTGVSVTDLIDSVGRRAQ